jgi:hypothetical protein
MEASLRFMVKAGEEWTVKWRNAEDMLLMPRDGGTISLAPNAGAIAHHSNAERIWHGCGSSNPGSLVRLAFHCRTSFPARSATSWKTRFTLNGTPGRTFASSLSVRSAALNTLSYGSLGMVPMAGLAPALDRF